MTTWARVACAPLAPRLAPTSRGSAPPRPEPAPPGIPRAPSFQPRRRAGQRFGGGGGGAGGGGGGGGGCSPTLSRQTGGATEAGPEEVSARPGPGREGRPTPPPPGGGGRWGGGPGAGPGGGSGGLWRAPGGRERSVAGRASPGLGAGGVCKPRTRKSTFFLLRV